MAKYDSNAPISVWVGNLGKYNEGELVGEWFSFPCEDFDEEWEGLMERIGIDYDRYEEVFCADWERDIPGLKFSEYPDYEELNSIACEWEGLFDWQRDAVGIRMEFLGEDFDTALRYSDQVRIYRGCHNMTQVAEEWVEETGLLDRIPNDLQCYFDYESYGRDMDIDGNFFYSAELGCIVEAY